MFDRVFPSAVRFYMYVVLSWAALCVWLLFRCVLPYFCLVLFYFHFVYLHILYSFFLHIVYVRSNLVFFCFHISFDLFRDQNEPDSLSLMHFRKNPNQNKTIQMKINFYTNKQTYIEMLCTYFGRSLCASATKYHLINWSLHSGRPILISAVDSVCIRMLPSLRLC